MTYPAIPYAAGDADNWDVTLNGYISDIDVRLSAIERPTINTQTGTAYTLVLADAGKIVERNNAAANTITIPPVASVAFSPGVTVYIRQMGAGTTTVVAGAGVTIRSRGGLLTLAGQYAEAVIARRAPDEWVLSGDLA